MSRIRLWGLPHPSPVPWKSTETHILDTLLPHSLQAYIAVLRGVLYPEVDVNNLKKKKTNGMLFSYARAVKEIVIYHVSL